MNSAAGGGTLPWLGVINSLKNNDACYMLKMGKYFYKEFIYKGSDAEKKVKQREAQGIIHN